MGTPASETHTFLFTDLEGSTALWERHPTTMGAALTRHDAILLDAITAHHGDLVKSTGDGVHAVFPSARDGVAAAVAAQHGLAEAEWPEGLALKVRMGVHLGDATHRDGDWYGTEVNRAARVMAVANGGQIVCSRVVEELVRDEFDLIDLGEHRLRDLQSFVHLFQVEVPGSATTHPPLRSLDAYRSNLPYELSSFIGREHEQDDVARRVSESRLVSVVGVGGVGKTRLALQVGSELLPRYADGVWFCELATVLDPDDIHDAIAAALKYTPPQGVTVEVGLQQFLEHKHLLVILDNCEHLVSAVAAFVSETTMHAPGVSVLATSREALGVRGEQIAPLASLSVPTDNDANAVLASEAGALFAARARESRGDLVIDERAAVAVHALCARLDGIPLALELAAAQTAMMTPTEIERRLDKQFRLASGGRHAALERHQTLRAAIDWSYDLLTPGARSLLARLSVCVGGFDLDAAMAIAAGIDTEDGDGFDLLRELVAKSLVERHEVNGVTRYRLLEMIRQYAADQLLSAGDDGTARDLHAAHYLARTVELVAEARSDAEYEVLETLGLETPNIAAGARWLLAGERFAEVLAMFDELPFFDYFALPSMTLDELGDIAEDAVQHEGAAEIGGFASACLLASFRLFVLGDIDRYQRLGDLARRTVGPGLSPTSPICDSVIAMFAGDLEGAITASAQAVEIARTGSDPAEVVWALSHYSVMENLREHPTGEYGGSGALAAADEALSLARRQPGSVICLYPLTAIVVANHVVDPDRARDAANETKRLDRTQRRWWTAVTEGSAMMLPGERSEDSLPEWRAVLSDAYDRSERFLLATSLATMGDTFAVRFPTLAADLGAIAESGAIAPVASFTVQPGLIRLAVEQPEVVAAARATASVMSYDEAMQHIFVAIDAVLAERDR
jgi:predicted ATPase/class 3 adenylate cyclase